MKERVLYVNLPDGAKFRTVNVQQDGKIGIVYTKEVPKEAQMTTKVPMPLIGGTNVYQKDNGTNYWYCKIKDGRDEFMYLPFDDITENDLLYQAGKSRKFQNRKQKEFKEEALRAIKNKPLEGYCWIPVYEPSMGENGEIQFTPGEDVLRGLSSFEWENRFNDYSPENDSQEASKTIYFLVLMRWLKDGIATLRVIADNSAKSGHFCDSEGAKHKFEKTGEREFGGLCGFAGNTFKEVIDLESESGFSVLGGCYSDSGKTHPLADVCDRYIPKATSTNSVGLLVLR